jgi:ABC-2 type transport system permease protein
MNRTLMIAGQEYRRNVFKRSFLLVLISIPALIAFSVAIGWIISSLVESPDTVGYVDQSSLIPPAGSIPQSISALLDQEIDLEFDPFSSEEDARAALLTGDIQAFFVLPETYEATRQVDLVYTQKPGDNVLSEFNKFLQINMLSQQDPVVAQRVSSDPNITIRSLDGKRVIPGNGSPLGIFIPLFVCMAFLFLLMLSSGYMMGAIADEKENRTMEVLTTTVSSSKLIAGKVLGVVGIGLTILIVWAVVAILGMLIASRMGVNWFDNMVMDWRSLATTLSVAIPAFVLVVALMTAIGAMVTTTHEGQSVSAIFFILHLAPLYIAWSFVSNPNGPIPTTLSLLPFTALMTLGMRNLFTVVPTWQIYASVAVQVACAVGAIWLAGRAFRLGMLRYGQRLPWRNILRSQG